MLGNSKRTLEYEEQEWKKFKLSHHAQRKFASNFPVSPLEMQDDASVDVSPKAEDFLDFLCFRHTPALAPELAIFAKPQLKTNEIIPEELCEDSFTESVGKSVDAGNQTNSGDKNEKLSRSEKPALKSDKVVGVSKAVAEKKTFNISKVCSTNVKLNDMKDFFKFIKNNSKVSNSIVLMNPPLGTGTSAYIQEHINLTIKTKHVHRLKHSYSKNFITFQCMKKQLEKEAVKLNEHPEIGGCEIDLPLLYDTVNIFGGIEVVNNDQCWKEVADNLAIPKTISRRAKKLEDIYLKYILPYETLPEANKIELGLSVRKNTTELNACPVDHNINKEVSLPTFEKLAGNYRSMYCKKDASTEDIVKQFWDILNKGERHVCAISSELDLLEEPLEHQNTRMKVSWNFQDLFSSDDSVLKYLGKVSKVSVPLLLYEGVFSTSKWCSEEHGFAILSYLHGGYEKVWFVIPEEFTKLFLQMKYEFRKFVTPSELISKGCKVVRCVQKSGQYVLVQPNCYYCTVSTGCSRSEVVKVAHMGWLTSRKFFKYKPKLNDFIFIKIILTCATEESKKGVKTFNCKYLISKLEAISNILSSNIAKFKSAGLNNFACANLDEWFPRSCSECNICCFLIRVYLKSIPDFYLCAEDALKIVDSKDKSDLIIEILCTAEKVNLLIRKLTSLKKIKQKGSH